MLSISSSQLLFMPMAETSFDIKDIPDDLLSFFEEQHIDVKYLESNLNHRYIRIRPDIDAQLSEIEPDLNATPVQWLKKYRFYALNSSQKLVDLKSFESGKIFGMDAASAVTVLALNPQPGDNVLDLCCCPGAKLSLMVDIVGPNGSVSGVDISEDRMRVCSSQLQKRGVPVFNPVFKNFKINSNLNKETFSMDYLPGNVFLYKEDGKSFDPFIDHPWILESSKKKMWKALQSAKRHQQHIKYMNQQKLNNTFANEKELISCIESAKKAADAVEVVIPPTKFSRILVDVECTHDGSSRHVRKSVESYGWENTSQKLSEKERLIDISSSQLLCLENAFKLLHLGGTLVYSTCSLSFIQNEDVIRKFLDKYENAKLQPIPFKIVDISSKMEHENSCINLFEIDAVPCRVRLWTNDKSEHSDDKNNEDGNSKKIPAAVLLGGLSWAPTDGQFICCLTKV